MFISARLFLFFLITFFALKGFCQSGNYDPAHRYPVDELHADFKFLRIKLEKIHPNLYLYTRNAELNLFFDSLYKSIATPSTELEFYNLITLLNSKIKDGHTMLLPGKEATNYFRQNAKFFPFYTVITNNKLYVTMNCSRDTSIKEGSEILGINGISATNIMNQLLMRQIRDGNNRTYPTWILNNYFKEYFSFSFGHPSSFSISYKKDISKPQTKTVYALSKDSISFYKQARYSNKFTRTSDKQGIILEIDKKLSIATLTIKSFDSDLLKSVYKQDFKREIKSAFFQIQSNNIENLILDIRNNQGGDFEPGRFLLSLLLRRPIRYLENSKEYKMITPVKNGYKKNLYILINGGSFSSTGIVSSYLELTKRGLFVGEETAGNKNIISGNSTDFVLPNTKIICEISTTKYVIRKSYNDGHGVVPAYYIAPAIDNIIAGNDTVKEFTLNLISKNKP